jgi:two-component system sensor histidine kinase YesM
VEARFLVPESAEGDRPFSSLIVCPLPAPHAAHGQLMAVTDAGAMPFTDLDFTVLQSHADFAALSIDNYLKYRQLIELREAEYQSLQARIQPHFLYNVMNGLIGLNRMGEKAAVEAAVLDLKDLLRYTLDHERTVSLEEELGFVRKYLDLQKLRFGERFDYRVSCAPACAALAIPKLLLQPLAENALIHGIEPMARNGLLEIDASGDPAVGVRVSIADNGAGFDPATRDATSRIGLSNVIKRLELAYPGSVFAIRSAPGQGCRVEIEIRPPGGQP